jgi:hypothetical protein
MQRNWQGSTLADNGRMGQRMPPIRHVAVIAAALGIACPARGAQVAGAVPPRDWTLREELRIGSRDDPVYALTYVTNALLTHDRFLYVAQPREQRVRVFDHDGRDIRSLGRQGGGPGEFQDISSLGLLGDSVYVIDQRAGRATVYAANGSLAYTFRLPLLPVGRPFSGAQPIALLPGSRVLAMPQLESSRLPANHPLSLHLPILIGDREGAVHRVIAHTTVGSSVLMFRVSGRTIMRTGSAAGRVFGDHGLFRVARDGSSVVLVDRTAATRSEYGEFRVTKVSGLTGDTVWSSAYPYRPQAPSDVLVENVLGREAESLRRYYPSLDAARAAVARVVATPRFLPPVTSLTLGGDGTIWLEQRDPVQERLSWTVLDSNGAIVARVESELWALRLLAVTGAVLWGAVEDEDDVSYLVRFSVAESS